MILPPIADLHRHLEQLARNVFLQLFGNPARSGIGVVRVHDEGERVHHISVQQNIQLDQLGGLIAPDFIIVAGVAARPAFQRVEEVVHNLIHREDVVNVHPVGSM